MFSNNQQDSNQMSAGEKHDAIMLQLDEIKRYVAGIFSKVDSEIDEIRRVVDRLDKEVRDTSQQANKIQQIEQMVRNLENTIRNIDRKIK